MPQVSMPDYQHMDADTAAADFLKRIEQYKKIYEPLDTKHDKDLTFIKLVDAGRQVTINNIRESVCAARVQCQHVTRLDKQLRGGAENRGFADGRGVTHDRDEERPFVEPRTR